MSSYIKLSGMSFPSVANFVKRTSHLPAILQASCEPGFLQVVIEISKGDGTSQLFTALPSFLGPLPAKARSALVPLKAASPLDACSQLQETTDVSGDIALLHYLAL